MSLQKRLKINPYVVLANVRVNGLFHNIYPFQSFKLKSSLIPFCYHLNALKTYFLTPDVWKFLFVLLRMPKLKLVRSINKIWRKGLFQTNESRLSGLNFVHLFATLLEFSLFVKNVKVASS